MDVRKSVIRVAVAAVALGTLGAGVAVSPASADSCTNATGDAPTITSATITTNGATTPIAKSLAESTAGALYMEVQSENANSQQGETCKVHIKIMRNYGVDSNQVNFGWQMIAGVAGYMLDHGNYATVFNGYNAAGEQVLNADSKIDVTVAWGTGGYSKSHYYQTKTLLKLFGNEPISLADSGITLALQPSYVTQLAGRWPTGMPESFNPLDAPTHNAQWYQDNGYNLSNGGNSMGGDRMFMGGDVQGAGGNFAHNFEYGLMAGADLIFSSVEAGAGDQASESQRFGWFEGDNTVNWSWMYSNDQAMGPKIQITMGNVHTVKKGTTSPLTEEVNSGGLRWMMPNAWTNLAFQVNNATAPDVVQGIIKVERQESGTNSSVAATTTAVNDGIIIDVGRVTFSSPMYVTTKNSAVSAKRKGKSAQIKVMVPTANLTAKKTMVAVYAGKAKKPVATKSVKRSAKDVKLTFKVKINKGGYYVKAGTAVIGSAVLR